MNKEILVVLQIKDKEQMLLLGKYPMMDDIDRRILIVVWRKRVKKEMELKDEQFTVNKLERMSGSNKHLWAGRYYNGIPGIMVTRKELKEYD